MGILILLAVIAAIVLLGRYALAEGHRIEAQKKFMKNMNNFDTKKTRNDKRVNYQNGSMENTIPKEKRYVIDLLGKNTN